MSLIQITPEDIYALRNGTGRPFTDHMDRLLRNAAAVVGIAPQHISDNPRTNVQDGGVDTEIIVASASDPWEYLRVPTCWQYKAIAVGDLTDASVRREIADLSKTYTRELIQKGYGYRMCVAHDGTAERKAKIKAALDEEIAKVNPAAPKALVLFASDIVAWTNAFPSLAATMLGTDLSGFKLFDTWRVNETANTPIFVPTTQSVQIRDRIREYLNWSKRPTASKLTISGETGVGKTRAVFEAISETAGTKGLTFYADDEDNAIKLAQKLANHRDAYAILVADECDDSVAFQIGRILKGFERRVRLITIDNALAVTDPTEMRLTPLSIATVEEVLKQNFPEVDASRRFLYSRIADGFLLFAISLCQNDALIQEQGHYGQPLRDTQSYLGALFGQSSSLDAQDREALDLIALVERCGVIGNVKVELEQLCTLGRLDFIDVTKRLSHMNRSIGLVGRAGRYFFVTPAPIAAVCFQSAWNRWAEPDTKRFLDSFPHTLLQGLLTRVSQASTEVGSVVNAYFRHWLLSRGSELFLSESDTERLLLLVRSDPDQMLNRLRDLLMAATRQQLAAGYDRGRRRIVTELAEIARFPQWFGLAEEMLFRLATWESEPDLGNNATNLWTALYGINGSAVATPFPERFTILRSRASEIDVRTRELCVAALHEALDERAVHLMLPRGFGRRIPPSPWYSETWGEYFGYLKECLALVRLLAVDEDRTVREKARNVYVAAVRHALFRNILEPTKEGAGDVPEDIRPILRSNLRELILLLQNDEATAEAAQAKSLEFITKWIDELAPSGLHDRLLENVGTDPWSHNLEQEDWGRRLDRLAEELVNDEGAIENELPWINSPSAASAFDLGVRVGRVDGSLSHLERIEISCADSGKPEFLRGYFVGVSETFASTGHEELKIRCNAVLGRLWAKSAGLAYDVMLPSGDFLHSFDRTLGAIRAKQLPPAALRNFAAWNGPRHTTTAEAYVASELLLAASLAGDKQAAASGIDLIRLLLLREKIAHGSSFLLKMFDDGRLETVFGLLEQSSKNGNKFSHWFPPLFQLALPSNPERAVRLIVSMLGSGSFEASKAASGLMPILSSLGATLLMEELGKALLDKEAGAWFSLRKIPVATIPEQIVIAWLKIHEVEGARVIARHLPVPYLDANGPELNPLTEYVMENFGDDDLVFSSFVAGTHRDGVFIGRISDQKQQGVTVAEKFINYPVESIRRWARNEVEDGARQVEQFLEREAESGW